MKTRTIKITMFIILGMTLNIINLEAQYKHEFSTSVGLGIQNLKYDGSKNNNFGYNFGIGYDYFFTKNIGIGTGAELSFYKGNVKSLSFKSVETGLKDYQNDVFNYNSVVTNYNEEQKATMLNIPLMLRYQTSGNNKFYLSAGTKIGIMLNGTYKGSGATYYNTADYTEKGVWGVDEPQFMGLGTFSDKSFDGDLDLKTSITASVEMGMKLNLGKSWSLYSGVYADYGLTDIINGTRDKSIVTYNMNQPMNFNNTSMLEASHVDNNASKVSVDKVIPVSFGLKLRVSFGRGEPCKQATPVLTAPVKRNTSEQETEEARRKAAEKAEEQRLLAEAELKRNTEKEQIAEVERKEKEFNVAKAEIAHPITGYTVNGTALSVEQKLELDKKIELLKKYPDLTIICQGYTCNLGSGNINENIGLKRANVAKEYFVEHGIAQSRVTVKSMGDEKPVVPNTNEENRRKNRRVEFIIN